MIKSLVSICLLVVTIQSFAQDVDNCCADALGQPYIMQGSTFPCCTHGNCTWWAAHQCREMNTVCANKNAEDWYTTAQTAKVEVGKLPAKGAVVCFSGNHVASVEDVKASTIVISEMMCDVAGVTCMRQRELPFTYNTIIGYIFPATNNVTSWDFKDRTLGWRIRNNASHADFLANDWWRLNPTGKQPQIYSPYSQTPIASSFKSLDIRYSIKGAGESVTCRAYFDTGTGFNQQVLSVQSIIRNNNPQTITFGIPANAIGKVSRVLIDLFDAAVYQDAQIAINNIVFQSSLPTRIVNASQIRSNNLLASKTTTFDILGRKIDLSSTVANLIILKNQNNLTNIMFYQSSENRNK
jgi:surface antigen